MQATDPWGQTFSCSPTADTSQQRIHPHRTLAAQDPTDPVLPQSNSFDEFILELKASIDRHMLPNRSIDFIFSDESVVPPGGARPDQ